MGLLVTWSEKPGVFFSNPPVQSHSVFPAWQNQNKQLFQILEYHRPETNHATFPTSSCLRTQEFAKQWRQLRALLHLLAPAPWQDIREQLTFHQHVRSLQKKNLDCWSWRTSNWIPNALTTFDWCAPLKCDRLRRLSRISEWCFSWILFWHCKVSLRRKKKRTE